MIKPEELRIGNTIETRLGGGEWRPCNVDLKDLSFIDMPDQKVYRPIPLTEERLVKMGWIKSDDKFNGLEYYYLSTKIDYIIVLEEGFNLYCITWWNYLGHTDMIRESDPYAELLEIKIIHHLQNIIFDLSGKELTIKE